MTTSYRSKLNESIEDINYCMNSLKEEPGIISIHYWGIYIDPNNFDYYVDKLKAPVENFSGRLELNLEDLTLITLKSKEKPGEWVKVDLPKLQRLQDIAVYCYEEFGVIAINSMKIQINFKHFKKLINTFDIKFDETFEDIYRFYFNHAGIRFIALACKEEMTGLSFQELVK